jgi:hypothetical protein
MWKEFVYGPTGCKDQRDADQVQRMQKNNKCEPLSL